MTLATTKDCWFFWLSFYNLPKWIWVSSYYHGAENVRKYLRKYKGNKNEKVIGLLKDLLVCERATINLDLSGSNSFN